jgi:hypothetical protein
VNWVSELLGGSSGSHRMKLIDDGDGEK